MSLFFHVSLVVLCLNLNATGYLRFDRISLEQGLSQSAVNTMIQDRQGFLWIGTQDGLNRYDGYEFVVYKHDAEDENSLSDSTIYALCEDDAGRIWIGTKGGGLNRFDPQTQTFTRFPVAADAPGGLGHDVVWSLYRDREDVIWIGTDGDGLKRYEPQTNDFVHYRHDPDQIKSLSSGVVWSIHEDRLGRLWVGTENGVNLLDRKRNIVAQYLHDPANPRSLAHNVVRGIMQDNEGLLWFATPAGLDRLEPEGGGFVHYRHDPNSNNTLSWNDVNTLYEDGARNLWIGTSAGGLCRLSPDRQTFDRFAHEPANPHSLSQNGVNVLFEDLSGKLWVGTDGGGVNRYDPQRSRFRHYRNDSGGAGLNNNLVWSIYKELNQTLWIGTEGGLNRLRAGSNNFTAFMHDPAQPGSLSHNRVRAILKDSRGRLWLGTGAGLDLFNQETERFDHWPAEPDRPYMGRGVRCLFEDSDSILWVGTNGGGLVRRDRDQVRVYRHESGNERSLPQDVIYDVFEDGARRLWVATGNGLGMLLPKDDQFTVYRRQEDQSGLSDDVVLCLYQEHGAVNSALWMGTYGGGLNRLDPESGAFTVYRRKHGLANDIVYGVIGDRGGFLWMSTNGGLSRFDPITETFKNFDASDGLQSDEFNSGSYFQAPDGQIFFGGINGLTAFYPVQIKESNFKPPMVLTDFLLFNQTVPLQRIQASSPLTNPIHQTHELRLDHSQHVISFEFAALHFAGESDYAYRMKGLDAEWLYTSDRKRFATYTNLDPGTYTFQVKGANADGVWNDSHTSLKLIIEPPPWLTVWALSLYALTALALVVVFLLALKQKFERERARNDQLHRIDLLKDEFLATTSHELQAPLSGMVGLAESLLDGATGDLKDTTRANLQLIAMSGKRLSNLVNDILDFSKLKNATLELKQTSVDVRALTDVVFTLSKPLIGDKDLDLINDVRPDLPAVWADENRISQIMHNLVGNAIKFTRSGTVTVSASVLDNWMEVRVTDTGIGIPRDKFETIFQSFQQIDSGHSDTVSGAGLGLSVTRKLVNLHGGKIRVESVVDRGSAFVFTLPTSEERAKPLGRMISLPDPNLLEAARKVELLETTGENHILIVDDEPINRQVLANHLGIQGYRLSEASNGQDALALIDANHDVDLVILDIMMPGMSGYEVCERLRARRKFHELPVIFLTAKNQETDLAAGFDSGANDYLTKPISKNELLLRVKTHLELRDINRTLERKVAERTRELERAILELRRNNLELESKNEELETLDGIVRTINRKTALAPVLQTILDQGLMLFVNAQIAHFFLWDESLDVFRFEAVAGYQMGRVRHITFKREELIQRYTQNTERIEKGIFLVRDFDNLPGNDKFHGMTMPKSVLSMPVNLNERLEGFLVFGNFKKSDAFDRSDVRKLVRFREHAVSALAKARFLQQLHQKNEEILRTQNQLVVQKKMAGLGALTAGIAHEINNPLNFINNFTEVAVDLCDELSEQLARDTPSETDEDVKHIIRDMRRNAVIVHEQGRKAAQIVRTMEEVAMGGHSERDDTDINNLVDRFVESTWLKFKPNAQLELKLDPATGSIPVMNKHLSRVVVNLVTNGLEALTEKALQGSFEAWLVVKTEAFEDHVELTVSDNGCGIPPDLVEAVFDPFFTSKPADSGNLGLGLFISFDIVVREHYGRLEVEQGQDWTHFKVTLPRDPDRGLGGGRV